MPANFAIVAPSDRPGVSVDAIARRLEAERRNVDRRRIAQRMEVLEKQRREFSELSSRIKLISADIRLNLPELNSLHRLAADALQLSKLLFQELNAEPCRHPQEVPPETIDELLALNMRQLEHIERQLWLLESFDTAASSLQECLHELQQHPTCPAGRIQQLARRTMLDVDRSSDAGFLRLDGEISLAQFLARRNALKHCGLYATGIQAAYLIAWMSRAVGLVSGRRELVTMAALLQDVGLSVLLRAERTSPEQFIVSKPDRYREHPAIGAAIVAGIREFQLELPALVAQHHERLDGTGYPRKLAARRLMPESRLLSIVSRYVELASGSGLNIPGPTGPNAILAPPHFAAIQLHREAEQGEFDLPLTVSLLQSLGFEFREMRKFEPGHLRLDTAHSLATGPHFRELQKENVPAPHFHRGGARQKQKIHR